MKVIHIVIVLSLAVLMLAQAGSPSSVSAAGATFTITRTDDPVPNGCAPGDCSLREAILASNSNGQVGADTIAFNIPGQGVHTITPSDGFPTIWGPVVLDGLTQPGASCAAWPPTLTIELSGANAGAGTSGLDVGGNSIVRGLVINRFKGHGLFLGGINGHTSIVRCNFIGTDPTGTLDLGNGADGIFIGHSSSNQIGSGNPLNRNLVSGNGRYGVLMLGSGALGNTVAGNYIGTDVTGQANLGNAMAGIGLTEDTAGNIIGGTSPSQGNVVAFNGTGILVTDNSPDNTISKNSIFSNTGLGIDLGNDGVDDNDVGDADPGPNKFQNYPSLNTASSQNGTTTIEGTLPGKANRPYIIEFFSAPACDESGHGEGRLYLGQQIVTTNAFGNAAFTAALPMSVPAGTAVTATATDSADGTSEFAQCRTVTGPSKQDQTITFAPLPNKMVGDPAFKVSASASSGIPVSFTASGECTVNSTIVTLKGSTGSCTITARQSGNDQYHPAVDVPRTFVIMESTYTNFVPVISR